MSDFRISYRYAKSLLQLSAERKVLSQVYNDSELIFNTLAKSKELRAVLKNPVLKSIEKKNLIRKIFEKKVCSESISFMDFVLDKNREDIFFEIYKEFLNLRDIKEGIIRAWVKSAVELSDPLKQKIEQKLTARTNKNVKADYTVDNAILGGFVVRISDMVIDASVKHQLELLRKKFSEEINFVQT
jgi:F-type H+-transporting ATPase subunit delta